MPINKAAKTGAKKPVAGVKPDFKKAAAGDVAPAAEPKKEKLGPKLRRKADIEKALKAVGAYLLHTPEGLYRIVSGGKTHPASKRRVVAMIDGGLLKRDARSSNRYVLGAEEKSAPRAAEAQ